MSKNSNNIAEFNRFSFNLPFWVQWGIVVNFLVFVLILTLAWLIKYPDKIVATGTLNAVNGPKEIISTTSGRIRTLFFSEGEHVQQNQVIGKIESIASYRKIALLSSKLDSMCNLVTNGSKDQILNFSSMSVDSLGEIQTAFQIFSNIHAGYITYLKSGVYHKKRSLLIYDIACIDSLGKALNTERELRKLELRLSDTTFQVFKGLKDQNVLSELDLRNERLKLLSKEMSIPQSSIGVLNNRRLRSERLSALVELESQANKQDEIFIQGIRTLKSQIEEWEKLYLLKAPISGTIAFSSILQENIEVKASQSICYVIPQSNGIYIESLVEQKNFGKVQIGQAAVITFPAYPFLEFGKVNGIVEFISSVPNDSGYFIKIGIPYGLVSNTRQKLNFKNGLSCQVEIITRKKRLIDRFFEKLHFNELNQP